MPNHPAPSNNPFSRSGPWIAVQLVLMGGLLLLPPVMDIPLPAWLRSLGNVMLWTGILLSAAAAWSLHRANALTPLPVPRDEATLQTTGLYGLVRHPVYTCLMLWAAGVALATASGLHVMLCTLLWTFFAAKARHEERMLQEKFPGYAGYAARTPRFFPRWIRKIS